MANALTLFDPGALPAHIAEVMESDESNIIMRPGYNSVTFPGKVWSITLNGEKRPLMKRNDEGEEEPVSIFNCIVLAYPERRGRAYYEGTYNPEQESTPVCWSNDGITSDENGPKRQAKTCNKCPMAAKNSRMTDNGKGAIACGQHRMLAVIPASRIGEFPPMRLKIPITSDYDSQNKALQAQGWYAFSNYMEFLKTKRVNFTYLLTTKIKFDPTEGINYPKLIFSPGKWLTPEQLELVKEIAASPDIEALLKTEFTPKSDIENEPAPVEQDELEDQPVVSAKPAGRALAKPAPASARANGHAPVAAPAPAPAPEPEEDEEEGEAEETVAAAPVAPVKPAPAKPAANPKAEAAAKAAAARRAAPQVADEDDAPIAAPAAPAKPAKAGGKPVASTPPVAASAAVNSVLADWDD